MDWVTIIWSMSAAVCLTFAVIHLFIWSRQPAAWGHLLFSFSAFAAAVLAAFELALMRIQTPEQCGVVMRWTHLPIALLVISLVCFVRVYLGVGRPWLAWSVIGTRLLALVLNFVFMPNLTYREINDIHQVTLLVSQTVSVVMGKTNPWTLIGQFSSALLLVFLVDAMIAVWRRGNRRRAVVLCGSMIFFVSVAAGHAGLVMWGVIHTPYFISLAYLGVIAAMGYELSSDVVQAAMLANQLRANEARLHDSEQRMELAANAAELAVWRWDIMRDEIWFSEKGRAFFGFGNSEPISLDRFLQVIRPEDRQTVTHAIANSMNGKGEYHSEYRVPVGNGQMRWIAGRGRVEFNGEGKPIRMLGASIDITSRKQAEESLRESESRFREMANAAPVMIWMSGTDRLCTFFNKGWLEFTGRALDQELGNGWAQGIHPEDRDRCFTLYVDSFDDRNEFTIEYRLHNADGEYRWVLDNGVPRVAQDGTFLGYIGTAVDITARRQAELEAQQQRAELAHLSRVTMLGELSGSLAHELNQPLTAILSNAQAAQRFLARPEVDLDEVRAILQDIVDADNRAGEVIRRLRLLLKKGEPQRQDLDVNDAIMDVLRLVNNDLVNHNITVRTELTESLPAVCADRVQIQQVLLNLIMNGCDAMAGAPLSDRLLTLRTAMLDGTGIQISVTDRGCGIPSEQLDNVFKPFFTTKAHGMGLGLTVCRTIIAAHGGRLWVTNEPDRGAGFHVALPAKPAEGIA